MQYLQRLLGEARTRILLYYTALTVGFVVVALPLMQQRIFFKVDERVREDLQEEVRSFKELLKGSLNETDRMVIKRILEDERRPFTKAHSQNLLKQVENFALPAFQSVSTDLGYEPRNSFRGGQATKRGRFILGNRLRVRKWEVFVT